MILDTGVDGKIVKHWEGLDSESKFKTCVLKILQFMYLFTCPYGTLYLHHDFTGIRENLNAKKHNIEICLL